MNGKGFFGVRLLKDGHHHSLLGMGLPSLLKFHCKRSKAQAGFRSRRHAYVIWKKIYRYKCGIVQPAWWSSFFFMIGPQVLRTP